MGKSKKMALQFVQKEIKTYRALALFLSKQNVEERARSEHKGVLISPAFYKQRITEAEKLVSELKGARLSK
jgi:hypothetical protein